MLGSSNMSSNVIRLPCVKYLREYCKSVVPDPWHCPPMAKTRQRTLLVRSPSGSLFVALSVLNISST